MYSRAQHCATIHISRRALPEDYLHRGLKVRSGATPKSRRKESLIATNWIHVRAATEPPKSGPAYG